MLRYCAIVPVYNHWQNLPELVQGLLEQELPVFLVDDASDAQTKRVLTSLQTQTLHVHVTTLAQNQGKGAAVAIAIQNALNAGFSHAIQIDADAQHSIDDVPQLLQNSRRDPQALVCGARAYTDMPAGRSAGRRLTDFWVHVNTLSFAIRDSMCGLRVYPMEVTQQILGQYRIGQRMDFDTDIAVKLYWAGLNIINVPVKVMYAKEVPSHFRPFKDNCLISLMHAKNFFGMLIRFPRLLLRNGQQSVQHNN